MLELDCADVGVDVGVGVDVDVGVGVGPANSLERFRFAAQQKR